MDVAYLGMDSSLEYFLEKVEEETKLVMYFFEGQANLLLKNEKPQICQDLQGFFVCHIF